jgi:hypothetical protein
VSRKSPSNVAASVQQRLLNKSRKEGEDYQLLLTRFALERFLYRLGLSRHKDKFILKGAMLFPLWVSESNWNPGWSAHGFFFKSILASAMRWSRIR